MGYLHCNDAPRELRSIFVISRMLLRSKGIWKGPRHPLNEAFSSLIRLMRRGGRDPYRKKILLFPTILWVLGSPIIPLQPSKNAASSLLQDARTEISPDCTEISSIVNVYFECTQQLPEMFDLDAFKYSRSTALENIDKSPIKRQGDEYLYS